MHLGCHCLAVGKINKMYRIYKLKELIDYCQNWALQPTVKTVEKTLERNRKTNISLLCFIMFRIFWSFPTFFYRYLYNVYKRLLELEKTEIKLQNVCLCDFNTLLTFLTNSWMCMLSILLHYVYISSLLQFFWTSFTVLFFMIFFVFDFFLKWHLWLSFNSLPSSHLTILSLFLSKSHPSVWINVLNLIKRQKLLVLMWAFLYTDVKHSSALNCDTIMHVLFFSLSLQEWLL